MPEIDTQSKTEGTAPQQWLPGDVREHLEIALRYAYPDVDSLRMMVRNGLDENLADISTAPSLKAMVHALVVWAEARNLERLLNAAVEYNPDNDALRKAVALVRTAPRVKEEPFDDGATSKGARSRAIIITVVAGAVVVAVVAGMVVRHITGKGEIIVSPAPRWQCRYRDYPNRDAGVTMCPTDSPVNWRSATTWIYEFHWTGATPPDRTWVVVRDEPDGTRHLFERCKGGGSSALCMQYPRSTGAAFPLRPVCGADGRYQMAVTRCSTQQGNLGAPRLLLENERDETLQSVGDCVRVDGRSRELPCR